MPNAPRTAPGGMTEPLFLLGAGFNVDAAAEASSGRSYPLMADLTEECFGLDDLPAGRTIEHLFQEALDAGRQEPVEKLCDLLIEADYYLGRDLTFGELANTNRYRQFLEFFGRSHFLTFNYDSLIEILLLRLGRWYPHDGYGVAVEVGPSPGVRTTEMARTSRNLVLHLHGTLCVYAVEREFKPKEGSSILWMADVEPPGFIFDPDTLGPRFAPFERVPPTLLWRRIPERLIAPIPDKSPRLASAFVSRMYNRATELIRSSRVLVSVGYQFAELDRTSFDPLLAAAESGRTQLVVVSPEANDICNRITSRYSISTNPVPGTFAWWVDSGCPLTY